jgi:hypothetical protein
VVCCAVLWDDLQPLVGPAVFRGCFTWSAVIFQQLRVRCRAWNKQQFGESVFTPWSNAVKFIWSYTLLLILHSLHIVNTVHFNRNNFVVKRTLTSI